MTPLIIFITGPACTGKTTLARLLADKFRLPLFYKDDFKERMYDAVAPNGDYEAAIDRKFSRTLGQFSIISIEIALEQCARCDTSAIFEANFSSALFSPRLAAIRERYPFHMVQVNMRCNGEVLLQRFIEREKTDRHAGHGGLRFLDELRPTLLRGGAEPLTMADGDILIDLDTTDLTAIDYQPIIEIVARKVGTSRIVTNDKALDTK